MSNDRYQLPGYIRLATQLHLNIQSADLPKLVALVENSHEAGLMDAAKVAESMSHRKDDMGAIIADRIRSITP